VIVVAYADVLVANLVASLLWDPARSGCPDCERNVLLVHASPPVVEVLDVARPVIGAVLCAIIIAILLRRWRTATAAGRRVLGPVV
jgi:hypothetical protein